MEKWWLPINLVGLIVNLFGLVYAYVGIRKGQHNLSKYIPGLLLVILGLVLNISRQLTLLPLRFSGYALWAAVIVVAIGCFLVERERSRDKASYK